MCDDVCVQKKHYNSRQENIYTIYYICTYIFIYYTYSIIYTYLCNIMYILENVILQYICVVSCIHIEIKVKYFPIKIKY